MIGTEAPRYTMHTCPHCQQPTVSFDQKWLSTIDWPAECPQCGALSYVEASASGVGLIMAGLLLTASGFAAVYFQAGWPFVLGLVAALAFYVWHWRRVSMVAVSSGRSSTARRTGLAVNLAVVLAWLVR